MRTIIISVAIALGILFSNCENNNSTTNSFDVHQTIIVDSELFINAPDDDFDFANAEIIGDSLKLTIRYGGGCGDVEIKLIDSGAIMESYPVQRNIRLSLKDKDLCKALLTKVISFNLIPVRVSDNQKVSLNLAGWESPLLYEY